MTFHLSIYLFIIFCVAGKGKQNEVAGVENKNLKTTKENSKKKRKAPDVPPEPKTKLNAFELNGASHTSSPLPIIRKLPSTASCESLTSSSVSTDYSATSAEVSPFHHFPALLRSRKMVIISL